MGLECLIVTCDSTLLGQIKAGLSAHGVSLDFRQDAASAIELASRRHLDGLVIDCDNVPGGPEAITHLRNSRSNRQSLIVAVVNGFTSPETALDLGASFVLSKPVQEIRLHSVLDNAVPKMEREHRRYFRYDVDLPVRLRHPLGQSFAAQMKNVSEGGMVVRLGHPAKLNGVVNVDFELPNVGAESFHGKADVVWSDCFAMGLRFLYIEKNSGIALQAWLSSLEVQFQFRECAQQNS